MESAALEMNDKLPAINAMLANPPAEIGFTVEQIEDIVRGEGLWAYLRKVDDGDYLNNFLSSLGWWLEVANVLLCDVSSGVNTKSSAEEYENIPDMISEIMLLYPVAFKARYLVGAIGSDPTGLELVKKYAALTVYIRTLVERDFPEANWSPLRKAA
jgi:hypothetical protein